MSIIPCPVVGRGETRKVYRVAHSLIMVGRSMVGRGYSRLIPFKSASRFGTCRGRPAKTWGRSSGDRDWGGVVCCCSADVVPEAAVQVGGTHVQQ
jgi:hypothetical protein